MTETTTIQITKDQAAQLAELKQYDDEPYKSVIARVLEDNNSAIDTGELVEQIEGRLDDLESQLPRKIAREIQG